MLNYNKWKKLNENMLSFNLGLSNPQNMGVMMGKKIESYMEDEDIEDEDIEDEEDEDIEDEDYEDDEDEDDEDEDDDDDDEEEDEDDDDDDDDEEDEDDEDHDEENDMGIEVEDMPKNKESGSMKYMKKDSSGCGSYMSSENMPKNKESDSMKKYSSGCGSYMAAENTIPKHIPTMKDWQESVASMLDNSCVTKKNFDGMVNESKKIKKSKKHFAKKTKKHFAEKGSVNYARKVNENSDGELMQQLQKAQQEMDALHSKMKGEKIPKILQDLMYQSAEKSRVIADIIGKMNPSDVQSYYSQRNNN